MTTNSEFHTFRDRLKTLRFIDRDEFEKCVALDFSHYPDNERKAIENSHWEGFRHNQFQWLWQADDASAEAVFNLLLAREKPDQEGAHNGGRGKH